MPHQRATEIFKKEIVTKHHQGISQQTLSQEHRLGNATIERWYHKGLDLKLRELSGRPCPMVMGIDEHFFTKKKGYATTFADIGKQRVFELALGRSEDSLSGFLKKLKDKERVKVMLMDLSETYRSITKKYFPNALIVADRFHVIRLINYSFLKVWHQLDDKMKWNRGLLSLVRRHDFNLRDEQKIKLRHYLRSIPGLEAMYDFKQDLIKIMLLKSINHFEAPKIIPRFLKMIEMLKEIPFGVLQTLGNTLYSWKNEIARMWRFTKTNSITEGLHTKMEMISRRAYGFRNFENYNLNPSIKA
jgi:transposase